MSDRSLVVLKFGNSVLRGEDDLPAVTAVLDRGGSDLTAMVVAHALGAARCRLVKDVDGIYERDPSWPARWMACGVFPPPQTGPAPWWALVRPFSSSPQP